LLFSLAANCSMAVNDFGLPIFPGS
jgi:hypothetical protein